MNVWVTRPPPGSAATASALRNAGYTVVAASVLEVATVPPDPRPALPPDLVVLVSANAARGLHESRLSDLTTTRFVAVGQRTADIARELGWQVDLVPENQRAEGLVVALAHEDLRDKRVWIPAGDRPGSANSVLPEALAGQGATVESFRVYETRDRTLSQGDLATLATHAPGAILVHSPSAAEAIFARRCPTAVTPWRERAVAIAIGPVTRVRLEELGVTRIAEAPEPSDSGVLAALAAIAEETP